MKTLTFKIPSRAPRDTVARALFDRNGEFKPRSVKRTPAWVRKHKNRKQEQAECY